MNNTMPLNTTILKTTAPKTTTKTTLIAAITAATIAASFSLPSFADTRYITDIISIPLRSDKDNQAGILKNGLPTGTKLKLIREEEDASKNKWSQVVTPDGIEGWIRSQHLINEPTAAIKLNALISSDSNLVELQKQNTQLKTELENLNQTYQTLLKETEEMRTSATSDINMEQENQKIHREFQLVQTERDVLKADNDQLKKADQYKQRIYGGLLIIGGVILSFFLQGLGKTKRHSEWN
jgi:SH3 domain protein